MTTLKALELHWIGENPEYFPNDPCVHGRVEFCVNNTVFVKPEEGEWSLSITALYLLRTLKNSHTYERKRDSPDFDNFLFPCCGHSLWLEKGKLINIECNIGLKIEIVRNTEYVTIRKEEKEEKISSEEWKTAVIAFVNQIEDFYRSSAPKNIPKDNLDREGWEFFWKEWNTRIKNLGLNPAVI